MRHRPKDSNTSWEQVGKWYDGAVGQEGHYYHQQIVLPGVLRLLDIPKSPPESLLDLGCGQGVLARQLPKNSDYLGLDSSPHLIKQAKQHDKNPKHRYLVQDVTAPFALNDRFDAAVFILSLQNMENPAEAIKNAAKHLTPKGKLVIVLNHPCFRIPRQSFWQVDEKKQCRYRRIERYLTPMKIPIQMNPSKGNDSPTTWSFHYPLSSYITWLNDCGLAVHALEEWCSDKQSTGKAARMENLSRKEFPLFLALTGKGRGEETGG